MRHLVVALVLLAAAPALAAPECRMGADGRQACGYHCRIGGDGRAACANTESGACSIGADGRAVCSQLAYDFPQRAACRIGADGRAACGYHCRIGADGRAVCADTPDGVCAMGADGRVECSRLAHRHPREGAAGGWGGVRWGRPGRSAPPASAERAECMRGADGRQVCGFHCMRGGDGRVACANTASGACARGGDGRVVCSWQPAELRERAECLRGGDGSVACGYSCTRGGNGSVACTATPDGVCARNADGSVTCWR